MKHPPPDEPGATQALTRSTTVLNRVAPTVVRRRIVEVPVSAKPAEIGYADEDDESGPPSSVNVARALASLRGHELRRLEEILGEPDDRQAERAPAPAAAAPEPPKVPTVRVGPTIALAQLAERMGVPAQDVVTALVTRGFFSVTVKTTLPRETARSAATLFGFQIEETDEVEVAPARRAKPTAREPRATTKAKPASAKSKPARGGAAKSPPKAPAKSPSPAKRPRAAVSRRTSRRA